MQTLKTALLLFSFLLLSSMAMAAQPIVLNPIYLLLLGNSLENPHELTVTVTGTGNGTVNSAPSGISCSTDCSAMYEEGSEVILTAEETNGSYFNGWSGDQCTGYGSCTVLMSSAVSVVAEFMLESAGVSRLNIDIAPNVTILSSPVGIDCPTDCDEDYATGTPVTLTASHSNPLATISGWQAHGINICGQTETCTVSMDTSKIVTALYDEPFFAETEPNGTRSSANPAALDGTITGVIGSRGDLDYFKISVDSPKIVTAKLSTQFAIEDERFMVVELRDSNGKLLTSYHVGVDTNFNINIPQAGDFYLVLAGTLKDSSYFNVDYQFVILSNDGETPEPAESEENNTFDTANALAYDESIYGSLMDISDVDWFKINSNSGGYGATLRFDTTEETANWVVTVYPDADHTKYPLARGAVKNGSELGLAPSTGYYIVVSDFRPLTGDSLYKGNPYTITVSQNNVSSPVPELEDNSGGYKSTLNLATSQVSLSGQSQLTDPDAGQRHKVQDTDVIRVMGQADFNYTFRLNSVANRTNWTIGINGVGLNDTWNAGNNSTKTIRMPTTGSFTFTVVAPTIWGESSAMYTITKE